VRQTSGGSVESERDGGADRAVAGGGPFPRNVPRQRELHPVIHAGVGPAGLDCMESGLTETLTRDVN